MTVTPPQDSRIAQLIDANLDRAREGLRVLEDWCRYNHENDEVVLKLKNFRHQIGHHHHDFYRNARATSRDKGLGLSHPSQKDRFSIEQIIIANAARIQEALRVIEEYSRSTDPPLAKICSEIRYELYELEINILNLILYSSRKNTLNLSNLYLITSYRKNEKEIIIKALKAGIKMVQYRCKRTADKEQYYQAKELASICKKFNALFIINDRVDLSLALNADGVHLGQEDIPTYVARELLGKDKLIGKSTHSIKEIRDAEEEGCDYLGVGPIFSSNTKKDLSPIGPDLVKEALTSTKLPFFAIGGINSDNLLQLKSKGVKRIAVSGAIMNSKSPSLETRKILGMMS